MHLVLKVLYDFVGSNGLQAFIESGVLLFFWVAVSGAIISCLGPDAKSTTRNTIQQIVQAANFNYVATVVAGLVLTAATGALGGKPASLPSQGAATNNHQSSQANNASAPSGTTTFSVDPQKQAFQIICAWSYIGLGILCLIAFVIPSPATHDLVKTVGLTTLGFAGTIIGGLSTITTNNQ